MDRQVLSIIHRGSEFIVKDDLTPDGRLATILERRGKYLFIRYDAPGACRSFYGSGKVTQNYLGGESIMPDPIPSMGIYNLQYAYEKFRLRVEIHEDMQKIKNFDIQITINKQDDEKN